MSKPKFNMNDLLNTQSKTKESMNMKRFKVEEIDLNKIVPNEKNEYGIRDIEELASTIELVGLMHNIVVAKDDDHYVIVSGERRYRAFKMLFEQGKEEYSRIPCKVEVTSSDTIEELKLIFANSQARDLTDYEKTYQAGRIKELLLDLKDQGYKMPGRLREIVADIVKVSPAQVGRMESINNNLTDPIKEEFKEQKINITTAYELSRVEEDKQEEVYQKVKTGEIKSNDIKEVVSKQAKPFVKQKVWIISTTNMDIKCFGDSELLEKIKTMTTKSGVKQFSVALRED